jgi:hypothetical protein
VLVWQLLPHGVVQLAPDDAVLTFVGAFVGVVFDDCAGVVVIGDIRIGEALHCHDGVHPLASTAADHVPTHVPYGCGAGGHVTDVGMGEPEIPALPQ